jgi:hypothetical protein
VDKEHPNAHCGIGQIHQARAFDDKGQPCWSAPSRLLSPIAGSSFAPHSHRHGASPSTVGSATSYPLCGTNGRPTDVGAHVCSAAAVEPTVQPRPNPKESQ